MSKGDRIEAYVHSLGLGAEGHHPCYLAYFDCFNRQEYYEAHDVLEHLWLRQKDGNYAFFKGLIQFAGAFVHLQKQRARPEHPKDGRRLHPAVRLFALAEKNLAPYGPRHLGLDLTVVQAIIDDQVRQITGSKFSRNSWHPENAPQIRPELQG
jgi:predicted metal-dependent hydrolase